MSRVHNRYDFYRARGLDVAQGVIHGPLTPELVEALGRLHDLLLVNEVMEGPKIRVWFEIPPELDTDFQATLGSVESTRVPVKA